MINYKYLAWNGVIFLSLCFFFFFLVQLGGTSAINTTSTVTVTTITIHHAPSPSTIDHQPSTTTSVIDRRGHG